MCILEYNFIVVCYAKIHHICVLLLYLAIILYFRQRSILWQQTSLDTIGKHDEQSEKYFHPLVYDILGKANIFAFFHFKLKLLRPPPRQNSQRKQNNNKSGKR